MSSADQTAVPNDGAPLQFTLDNGLEVVYQPMPWLPSLSVSLVLPFGSGHDPVGLEGSANVLHEWLQRGAGGLSSRQLTGAMEDLGMRRGGGPGREYSGLSASFLAAELDRAMPLFASLVTDPLFEEAEFESARELAQQELEALKDAPNQQLFIELLASFITSPQGRSGLGSATGLAALTPASVRSEGERLLGPRGAILALAGGADGESIERTVREAFSGWTGASVPIPDVTVAEPHRRHVQADSSQVQIGLAFPSAEPGSEEAYIYGVGLAVLSGSSGARLFTEVREKRGLVYSVSAFTRALRGFGYTVGYAGTTPDRAEETLEVFVAELQRLHEGVSAAELERAKTGLLSSLVMQSESSLGTAGRLGSDMFNLGRPRTLAEVTAKVEGVSLERLNDYLAANPLPEPTIMTLGPSVPLRGATPSAVVGQGAPAAQRTTSTAGTAGGLS